MIQILSSIPYAIDLGNGFTKRTNQKSVSVEPSIIAEKPDFFNTGEQYDTISFNGSPRYYVGNDVVKSELPQVLALGDDDMDRYSSLEFKQLLFGFIAKDFRKSVVIPHLVTGLPVNHFKAKSEELKQIIKGKKVIEINGQEIIIEIQNVHVLPQPIGTYMYLASQDKINADEELTLIIDGGHGTIDITEMKGQSILRRAGAEKGVRNAHVDIYNYLVDQFGDMRQLSITNMPILLQKGMKYDKKPINISEIPEVKNILRKHFNEVFAFIRENRFDLKSYENVVFTGGMSLLHKELIKEKARNNFLILEESQEANVLGYFEFGKAVVESEKSPAVR
jgi:plasmid segregation protein ParM